MTHEYTGRQVARPEVVPGLGEGEGAEHEVPLPAPAAAGMPPSKPPTAVGANALPPEDDRWEAFRQLLVAMDTPVDDLTLPESAKTALRRHGIRTLGQVLQLDETALRQMYGLKREARVAIRRLIREARAEK